MLTSKDIPSVWSVVPNRNGMSHLCYSIPSLLNVNYSNYNVVVVDNASDDESINFLNEKYPSVITFSNKNKPGFAGAVNAGIKYAFSKDAEYIAVTSNDIKVKPEWINAVLQIFQTQQSNKIGLIGFKEIAMQQESTFNMVNISLDKLEITPSDKGVPGCFYVCPASIFKEVGLFDEDYFMYGEDNDFFHRLTNAGYCIVQTQIPVLHYGESSSENRKLETTWLAYRNAIRFSIKNKNIFGVVRMCLSLVNQGCNPFLQRPPDDPNFKRLRRFNVVINLFLIGASLLWNVLHIASTFRAKNKTYRSA